ncbi:MAG: glycosyltransferase family 39 protein [Candidatus Hydrogenedentes bacterium]|nr:glycosyltransferase family 39 protein [Candidatus Hydrogenedentota bacterium]
MSIFVLLLASYSLGTWTTRFVPYVDAFERESYRVLAGLIASAIVAVLFGSLVLRGAWWFLAGVAVVGGVQVVLAVRRAWVSRSDANAPLDWIERVSLAAVLCALTMTFIGAQAPVTGWDAGVAHAALPAHYVRTGQIALVDGNSYSAYPHLMHSLYAVALFGGERSMTLVSWLFGLLACGMAFAMGTRMECRRCGIIAAALVATMPLFVDQAGTPSLDLAFTAMTLAALNAWLAWRQERHAPWLLLAAILAGSSCGVRHTGYLVCALLTAMTIAERGAGRLRAVMLFALYATLGAFPWLARSAAISGNPFYPLFSGWLGPASLPDVDAATLLKHSSIQGTGVLDFLLFPFRVILQPLAYGGWLDSPGMGVLLLGIPGLIFGGIGARRVGAFSGAGIACMFFFRRFARYLAPFFAPMLVLAAVAACRATRLKPLVWFILGACYATGIVLAAALTAIRLPAAVGLESRDAYLSRRVERYTAFAWANENVDTRGVLLTLDPRGYYYEGPSFVNFEALKTLVPMDSVQRLDWLSAHGIRYLLYPQAYVTESPAFRETGVGEVIDTWRADTTHFRLLQRFDIERPKSRGREIVELYAVESEGT